MAMNFGVQAGGVAGCTTHMVRPCTSMRHPAWCMAPVSSSLIHPSRNLTTSICLATGPAQPGAPGGGRKPDRSQPRPGPGAPSSGVQQSGTTTPSGRPATGGRGSGQGSNSKGGPGGRLGDGRGRVGQVRPAPGGPRMQPRGMGRMTQEDDEEDGDEQEEEGELITDADEVERLVFGGKDFTKDAAREPSKGARGAGSNQSRMDALAACRTALGLDAGASASSVSAASVPRDLAELAVAAVEAGTAPRDPSALTAALTRLTSRVAEGGEAITPVAAVQRLAGWLGEGVKGEEVLGGALAVPRVLCLSEQEVKARVPELVELLKVQPARLPRLLAAHPELLVAPLSQIAGKLRALKVTTGLEGEGAVALMNPHMMGGM